MGIDVEVKISEVDQTFDCYRARIAYTLLVFNLLVGYRIMKLLNLYGYIYTAVKKQVEFLDLLMLEL